MNRVIMIGLLVLLAGSSAIFAKGVATAPVLLDPGTTSVSITGARFVTEVMGTSARWEAPSDSEYRGVVVTLEVRKPAGSIAQLNVADLSLHYTTESNGSWATRCQGLSNYSLSPDNRSPMSFTDEGLWSVATKEDYAREAETVYIDAFFTGMERDTRDLWICLAAPADGPWQTDGWGSGSGRGSARGRTNALPATNDGLVRR